MLLKFIIFILLVLSRVRKYGEGGSVEVEKYACVFRGREGQKSDFFCVRNMWMPPIAKEIRILFPLRTLRHNNTNKNVNKARMKNAESKYIALLLVFLKLFFLICGLMRHIGHVPTYLQCRNSYFEYGK